MSELYPDNIDRFLMQEHEGRYYGCFFKQPTGVRGARLGRECPACRRDARSSSVGCISL